MLTPDNSALNLPLRTEILEKALHLEYSINKLLLFLLRIDAPKLKALSHKSGSLSFKNKLDLLFDIEVLSADEHMALLLVMEYRNQFMHNIDCASFRDASNLLGVDKVKRLLKHGTGGNSEEDLSIAFGELFCYCIKIISNKTKRFGESLNISKDMLEHLIDHTTFLTEAYYNLLESLLKIAALSELETRVKILELAKNSQLTPNIEHQKLTEEMQRLFSDENLSYVLTGKVYPPETPNP